MRRGESARRGGPAGGRVENRLRIVGGQMSCRSGHVPAGVKPTHTHLDTGEGVCVCVCVRLELVCASSSVLGRTRKGLSSHGTFNSSFVLDVVSVTHL